MCSNPSVPFLAGFSRQQGKAFIFKADCDMWTCAECAERKKNQWLIRAQRGSREIISSGMALTFATITSHRKLKSSAATLAVFPRAWGKLYKRLKRKTPDLKYLMILEHHKNGRIHAHMLSNCDCSKRWLKDNAAQCGFGFMADIQPVTSERAVAGYVTKYLTKSLAGMELPQKTRRVRASENWYKLPENDGGLVVDDGWLTCTTKAGLWAFVEAARAENLTIVNPRTGELFDYADACETWYQ
jgi:hypothetical protein